MLVKELHDVDSSTRSKCVSFLLVFTWRQHLPPQPTFALELHFSWGGFNPPVAPERYVAGVQLYLCPSLRNAFCSPAAIRRSRETRNSKSTCLCCSCTLAVLPTVTRRLTSHPVYQSTQQSLLTACACFWRQNFARARCKYLLIRSGCMVYEWAKCLSHEDLHVIDLPLEADLGKHLVRWRESDKASPRWRVWRAHCRT